MLKDVYKRQAEGVLRLPGFFSKEKQMNEKALNLLEVFDLADDKDRLSSNLPYGKQRKLEIARALATSPKLLLLDEPAALSLIHILRSYRYCTSR